MAEATITLEAQDVPTGDEMSLWFRDGVLHVEIDEPWVGDSESGFGRTGNISLSKEQAVRLRDWLTMVLEQP